MPFSVLMSVYPGETAANLEECLTSLSAQSLPADQIVVVRDGVLAPELEKILERFSSVLPFEFVQLDRNEGLGRALAAGLPYCRHDIVARADSDDVYPPTRFAKQVTFLLENPDASVVSAAGAEFETDYRAPLRVRTSSGWVKLDTAARLRNPISFHTTVVLRKSHVLAVGNYQSCLYFEDFYLWARMLLAGYRIFNMSEVLAYVRCGNGMLSKRRGLTYVRHEFEFLRKARDLGYLSRTHFLMCCLLRLPLRLMPSTALEFFYGALLRRPFPVCPTRKVPGT